MILIRRNTEKVRADRVKNARSFGVAVLAILAWLLPSLANSAIVHEETLSASAATYPSSAITVNNVGSGTDQLYLVAVSLYDNPSVSVSSITGGGLTWSLVKRQCTARQDRGSIEVWKAFGSPGAIFNASITLGAVSDALSVSVSRYSGADSTTPTEGAAGSNTLGQSGACSGGVDDTALSLSLTSSNNDSVLFVASHPRKKTLTKDVDYTQRATEQDGNSLAYLYTHDRSLATAGADSIDHTAASTADWAIAGVVINPAGAGGGAGNPVVNSTGDAGDNNAGDGVCDTGGTNSASATECTLRAAIEESNAYAGLDTITFNMPTSEPGYLASPLSYTTTPATSLPTITDQTIIDGSSQTGFAGAPIVVIDGNAGATGGSGLTLDPGSDGSTLRGLVINDFSTATYHGIRVNTSNNTIAGNWIGLDADGITARGNGARGVDIRGGANNNTIGGTVAADRNVIAANMDYIQIHSSNNNIVLGNYLGTNSAGTAALGSTRDGVRIVQGSVGNTIGGSTVASRNIIAAAANDGVQIDSTASGTIVQGNYIGTDVGGTLDLGHGQTAVQIGTNAGNGNLIGGAGANEGNLIAYSKGSGGGGEGVLIESPSTDNAVLGNAIHSNSALGIDLSSGTFGVTANDAGDVDTGPPNDFLNFPVITAATEAGGTVTVNYDLDAPAGNYRIEFFSNPSGADPSGNGEGEVFKDAVTITHGGTGVESFVRAFAGASGDVITATATEEVAGPAYNSTSEFSATFTVTATPAVTSAVAEISPNDVTTSATGNSFSYDIALTIGGGDTGVNSVAITVPASFGAPTVTDVLVGGVSVGPAGYTDNTNANDISVDLTTKVTTDDRVTVLFGADAPTSQDLTGANFLSTVDDSATADAAQSTTEGNGDGDVGDNNSWTVTTTDAGGGACVAVDGSASAGSTETNSLQISHSTSGTDRLMLVGISIDNNSYEMVSSVTYNSIALTSVGNVALDNDARVEIWQLTETGGLPTGTFNVDITFSADLNQPAIAGVMTFTGVDQTTPLGIFASNTGTSNAASVNVSSAVGELVYAVMSGETVTSVATDAPATERWNLNAVGSLITEYAAGATDDGAGSVNMSWSLGSADYWAAGGVPIKSAGSCNAAATSIVAEISPNDVTTSSTGNAFSYDIQATIGGSDTGVNTVAITVPASFGVPTVTDVLVDSLSVPYTNNTSGNAISVVLTSKVTTSSRITVLFSADAPTTQDLTGVDFVSTVDDNGTGNAAQATTEGNGDADVGDNNSWTVTTTDGGGGGPVNPVVNSTGDGADNNAGNGVCDTGGLNSQSATACTLRAAIQEANASTGLDTITFNMPTTEPGYSAAPLSYTITPASSLPAITEQVVIDASTQTDFPGTPIVVLDGNNLAASGLTLGGTGDSSTVRGFVIRDFGSNGIHVEAASDGHLIAGNYIGRLTVSGTAAAAGEENSGRGIEVLGSGSTIGGTTAADRNVISGGGGEGIIIRSGASGNIVRGNYIGVLADGTTPLGNDQEAIQVDNGSPGTIIGGSATGAGNVIGANGISSGAAISIGGDGSDNTVVQGNYVGTDATGSVDLGNLRSGVEVRGSGSAATSPLNTLIGGTNASEANVIRFNDLDGVRIRDVAVDVAILGNAIDRNDQQGIDLWANSSNDNVTANDANDSDSGSNNLANFPVITSAIWNAGSVDVNFDLDVPAGNYRVEFFRNPTSVDPSGNGEGEVYMDFVNITHGGSGSESFSTSFSGSLGDVLSVTATEELSGPTFVNTSEFSATYTVTAGAAVSAAEAEISPNDITTNAGAYAFAYDINATIGAANTGVDRIAITVPGTFGVNASPVTNVLIDGATVAFTDNTVGNAISVDLTIKVTSSARITILFNADAPSGQDLTGADFTSTVDDSSTGDAAQAATEGNGDGDTTGLDSWTVTTTDLPTGGGGGGSCPITVDDVSTGTTTGSSVTIPHTTSGTDRLMLVGISFVNDDEEEVVNPGGVTYNGDALTREGVILNQQSGGDDSRVEIWSLVAPDTGTNLDLVVNFDANLAEGAVVGVMTFNGVDQTTPLGPFASNEEESSSSSVTVTSAADELVFALMSGETTGLPSANSPAVQRWSLDSADTDAGGATRVGDSPNTTVSFSHGDDYWAVGGISIKPAQTCGGTDHFSIVDDGNTSCSAETVTISAHSSGHGVDTGYTGLVRLTTSTGNGNWSIVSGAGTLNNSGNGNAIYFYAAADLGSVQLALLNTNVETLSVNATNGSATEDAGEDPVLDFTSPGGGGGGAITLEETITGSSSASPVSLTSISGGTDQTYVLFVASDDNMDVTAVSGGGLTWTMREEQCGTKNKSRIEAWTAQGSPGAFQASVTWDDNRPMAAVLARYSGVGGFGSTSSANPDGVNASCSGDTKSNPATISLTSTVDGSVHVIGTNTSDKTWFSSVSGGYTHVGTDGDKSDGTPVTVYQDSFSPASASTFDGTMSGNTWWASAGIVLEPAGGGCGGGTLNHFSISHDGSGINCQAEPVTIEAHDSGHSIMTAYTGVATLSTTTSHGDWSLITGSGTTANSGNGMASYVFDATDNGSVVLGLRDTFVETTNIDVTDGSAIEDAGEDANLVFARAGFNFLADSTMNTIGVQIGGKASNVAPGAQTLELQAVNTNDDTGACEAALTGTTTIEIGFECEDPISCSASQLSFSGTNLPDSANNAVLSYTGISMDFGTSADSTASFTMSYPDVGKVQLHARSRLMPSGEAMLGGSNSFVVRPFAFDLTATGNPAATGPGDAVFTSAGTDFTADVTALLWEAADDTDNDGIADNHDDSDPSNNADLTDNLAALNYGNEYAIEQILLTAALDQPAGGANPGLSGGTSVTIFTNGSGNTTTLRYDEVGIIEMSANVADNDYLGIGATESAKITSKSGYVGRFNPAQYAVTTSAIDPACSATFTYARQPFTGSMTIEAQNGADGGNTRTENFRDGFVTLDPATELTFINSVTSGAYQSESVTYNQNFDSGNYGEAVLALQFRWDMPEQAPTTSTVQNTAVTDEVTTLAAAPVSVGSSPTRYGRALVGTATGSELVDLDVVMRTEYYLNSNSGYVVSTDDFCNTGAALSLSNFTDNLGAGETCVQDSGNPGLSGAGCAVAGPVLERYDDPLIAGNANLFLKAPGAGNDGSAILGADVPDWLEFDWDTGVPGTEDPIGHITFGIYGGDKNQIYRRELY